MSAPLYLEIPACGVALDARAMRMEPEPSAALAAALTAARAELAAIDGGAVANPDEGRQVGHYWLRAPALAPDADIRADIEAAQATVTALSRGPAGRFEAVLHVGIGGSALGPQLLVDALAPTPPPRALHFADNIDPAGLDRTLAQLDSASTLVVVVSKSGGTVETRDTARLVARACARAGVRLAERAVAVTAPGSALHQRARDEGWLGTVPIWDWVGGRTSLTSPVGLLTAALTGIDGSGVLAGAAAMDAANRLADGPATLLARAWFEAGAGRGRRAMVVLPYADRLALLGRYLQQLVMESLGKRRDRGGALVEQGLTVYGHKGSTDQHAYVQQLREGPDDFFVNFVEVLDHGPSPSVAVEVADGVVAGDVLGAFLGGTRAALTEAGRRSLTLTLERLDAGTFGALVALYERAVGLYASLIDVNAYHQPGVEAGKRGATTVLRAQRRLQEALAAGAHGTAADLAGSAAVDPDLAFAVLRRLASSGRARVISGAGLERVFGPA